MIEETKIKKDLKIPYLERADTYLGYPEYSHTLVDNTIFTETLYYDTFSRGRSSIKFYFKNQKGTTYEMFAKDFSELVKNHCISEGVTGKWSFRKQGSNFGLTMVI